MSLDTALSPAAGRDAVRRAVAFREGPVASPDLRRLRLVRAYRGYRCGEVIQATSGLAATLVREGVAQEEPRAGLFEPRSAERAVASTARETR